MEIVLRLVFGSVVILEIVPSAGDVISLGLERHFRFGRR